MPHIHTGDGEFDFTVAGYLIYQDKTLLIQHKKLPMWAAPSGHVELTQTPIDALYAEIEEEAGIRREHLTLIETHTLPAGFVRDTDSTRLPLPFDLEAHPFGTDPQHRHINLSYILMSDTNHVEPGPGESNTFKWFTVDELQAFTDTKDSVKSAAIYAIEYVREHHA